MSLDELRKQASDEWGAINNPTKPQIFVGQATCGEAAGAGEAVSYTHLTLPTNREV